MSINARKQSGSWIGGDLEGLGHLEARVRRPFPSVYGGLDVRQPAAVVRQGGTEPGLGFTPGRLVPSGGDAEGITSGSGGRHGNANRLHGADADPPSHRGVRARPGVAYGHHPRRHGRAIHQKGAVAILDLGHHHRLLIDGLAIEPMGGQRTRLHGGFPGIGMLERSHRRVPLLVMMPSPPGPVVRREGQDRDAAVVLEQRTPHRRDGAVGRPVVPAVEHEPAVIDLLRRPASADGLEEIGQARTTTGGVDDQIGGERLTGLGPHPGHVGYAGDDIGSGHETADCHPPADRDARASRPRPRRTRSRPPGGGR